MHKEGTIPAGNTDGSDADPASVLGNDRDTSCPGSNVGAHPTSLASSWVPASGIRAASKYLSSSGKWG